MAPKTEIEELKRRHGRRILRLPGVSGVGVERGDGGDDYVLVVYLKEGDEAARAGVLEELKGTPVRFVSSATFRKL